MHDTCFHHNYKKKLMLVTKSFLFSADNKMHCPKESGYCVLSNGDDQNTGVIKINSIDGDTQGAQEECLRHCHAREGATGCEVIWSQSNRGCYIHTQTIAKGNNAPQHLCWVFSKCSKGEESKGRIIACLELI